MQVKTAVAAEAQAAIEQFNAIAATFGDSRLTASVPPSPGGGGGSTRSTAPPASESPGGDYVRADAAEATAVVDKLRRRKVTLDEGAHGAVQQSVPGCHLVTLVCTYPCPTVPLRNPVYYFE
jgi:hypothetical protein